jgi:hypothetical protein
VDAIDEIAKDTGKSVPQIALNWLLQRPTVSSLIIGARNEEQLRQNLGAVGWRLTAEQLARLDKESERPAAYPYWHQAGFGERNPGPLALEMALAEEKQDGQTRSGSQQQKTRTAEDGHGSSRERRPRNFEGVRRRFGMRRL